MTALDGMVLLQSQDGAEFVVSAHEASQSMAIDRKIRLDSARRITPSDDGAADETEYTPICLPIQGSILSKVLQYCKKHAAASPYSGGYHDRDLSGWDAKFIEDLDHDTLCDLILAAHYLCNQGLLHLTCQSVAKTIKGKSSHEICNIYNIKSNVDQDRPLTREQNALKALHVVRCQEFTAYDFRRRDFICTRFCHANITFFDLDEESSIGRGPPLDSFTGSILDRGVQSSVNIISLKIAGSEVGYPFTVFGTVIARDQVDYKCLYLFRREKEDAQLISSPDDMLNLIDPCRALVLVEEVYFEIDLKICAGSIIKDFSKGVMSFSRAHLPVGQQSVTLGLRIWLSDLETTCEHVRNPVEATIAVNILKGPCSLTTAAALAGGSHGNCILLIDPGTATCHGVGSVLLPRSVLAIPWDKKLVIHLGGDEAPNEAVVTLGQSDEGAVCQMGSSLVEIKVAWRAIPKRSGCKIDVVGDVRLLL